MTGMTSTTTTTEFGITSKSIPTMITTTTQAKKMVTSSAVQTVLTMMMTATMRTSTKTVSSKQFGTKESCPKASANHHFTTWTMTTMVSQMQKIPMMITTVSSMLTKPCSRVVSGAKKSPHSITITMELLTGLTMIGMPTVFQTTLNLPSASLLHSITTTTEPVTTSIRTTTKME